MKLLFLALLISVSNIGYCYGQSTKLSASKKFEIKPAIKVLLKEKKYPFTRVSDIVIGNQFFFISCADPAIIIKYNFQGKQIKRLGQIGRGPFEYISPSQIALYHDTLFVWDSKLVRLQLYNQRGIKINETDPVHEAIGDFKIEGDKIAFYTDGKLSKNYIKIYSYKRNHFISKLGKRNDVHDLLMMYENSGGLAFLNKHVLLYGSPGTDKLFYYNMKTREKSSVDLREPAFKINTNHVPQYHSSRDLKRVTKYLFNSSRLSGIYKLKNHVIVELQVGKKQDKSRADILYILNNNLQVEDKIYLNYKFLMRYGQTIAAVHGNTVYYLNNYSSKIASKQGRLLTGFTLSNISN